MSLGSVILPTRHCAKVLPCGVEEAEASQGEQFIGAQRHTEKKAATSEEEDAP